MRIVIDIEGDEIRVHRLDAGELPPPGVLERAAASNAMSAGVAMIRRPDVLGSSVNVSPEELGMPPFDAGRCPGGSSADPASRPARPARRKSTKKKR